LFRIHTNESFRLVSMQNLKRQWLGKWKGTPEEFCSLYDLSLHNFNKFLNGKKRLTTDSRYVLERFLNDNEVCGKTIVNWIGGNFNAEKIKNLNLDLVVFIDEENTGYSTNFIWEVLPTLPEKIHVVLFYGHKKGTSGKNSPMRLGKTSLEDISFCPAQVPGKNAADFSMIGHTSSLNLILDPKIDFVLFSEDHFVDELQCLCGQYSQRNVSVLKTREKEKIKQWFLDYSFFHSMIVK
jgi:hypothetical protein